MKHQIVMLYCVQLVGLGFLSMAVMSRRGSGVDVESLRADLLREIATNQAAEGPEPSKPPDPDPEVGPLTLDLDDLHVARMASGWVASIEGMVFRVGDYSPWGRIAGIQAGRVMIQQSDRGVILRRALPRPLASDDDIRRGVGRD